ncbi:Hydrogen peroxide-inducible genes activator [Posidoniimonas corsicana]|uniref:Hydrogen peroxide-inducible genes activator n=1 Tax=Posidoniimonas corsicana TaxID=1938618 RepID=A0A5C5V4M5_9BACT|nr:LysR family transcriptional regulator [Posidoniimonas corsicana]TWT33494.1 Hydrogen peroxide-inducible genes activator [Posidoniimonas corsicana]
MDTDQLRQFLRVAERGNITHASEELGVSQPTLSRSIQRLEEEFGQPLLERRTRSIALTDAGRLLESRAKQVLQILDDAKTQIADDGQSGQLRIASIPTVAPYFLPDFLRCFHNDYPDAMLVVQEDTTDKLVQRCKDGEIDLAVLALPISAKYLQTEPLFSEPLLLVTATDHPLATKAEVTLEDVEPCAFILLDEAHCLTENVVSFCRQRSIQPVAVERTSQLTTVQELVSLGHGVSMIPAMARRLDESPNRVYRTLAGEVPNRTIAMLWNPYRFESKLQRALKERLRSYAAEFEARLTDGLP